MSAPAPGRIPSSLFQRSVRGAQIITLTTVASALAQLASQVILMRIMSPEDFGAAAYIVVIIGTFKLFTSLQPARIIIQRPGNVERIADCAFATELCLSGLAFVAAVLLAGPIMRGTHEWFFERELQVAAAGLLAGPFLLPKVLMEKRLDFLRSSLVTFTEVVVAIGVQIVLALAGMRLWALILGTLAGQVGSALLAWIMAPYRPSARFDRAVIREIAMFGLPLAAGGALAYFYWSVDGVIVKLILGTAALGFYSKAFRLPHYGFRIQTALSTMVYPAFSSIRDKEHLCRAYGHAIRYSSYLLLLPVAMVIACGTEIVVALFGPKWLPITIPFKIFMVLVAIRGTFNHWVDLYISRGRTRLVTLLSAVNAMCIVSLGYAGVRAAGIIGMASAVFLTICSTILVAVLIVHREYPVRFWSLLRPAVLSAGSSAILGFACRPLFPPLSFGLALDLAFMSAVYAAGLFALDRDNVRTLWGAAWERFGSR
ncbi:MAG: oligosaccharide flippase family protein [Candidatus Eisenbacteria bacterium]|jgi:PST family polysaccharide transporter|nr:oligosaccharide flippase family protein [Candidatus Eisenbacteria bacterium]